MAKPDYRVGLGDQYLLRMPPGLREQLAERSRQNGTSVSHEIIAAIESYLAGSEGLVERVARIEKHLGLKR